jgi:hypothetical protein
MRRLGLGVAMLASASCSLLLDWDGEPLPCDRDKECDPGFSCLGEVCVSDHSLDEGETCNLSVQCDAGLRCTPYPYHGCRKPCADAYFKPTGDCTSGEYCRPYLDGDALVRGACVPSDCGGSRPCRGSGMSCVPIVTGANACLSGCEISWNGGTYGDNCGSTAPEPKYCQPLGVDDTLVCLDADNPQAVQQPCEPVVSPCANGFVCQSGQCHQYCDPAGGTCPGGANCVIVSTGPATYGYCDFP